METKETVRKAVDVVLTMARAIVEAKRVPEGHLYAAFMTTGLGLDHFQQVVAILVKQGVCERQGNELVSLIQIPA